MRKRFHNSDLLFFGLIVLCFASCADNDKLFSIKHADDTGIGFQNTIVTSDTFNALKFEYIYNGSGVGIGDFNNDGFEDIYFGGNQVSGQLYLNSGNMKFEDVTKQAGVATDRWVTGVSVVDINQDGLLDVFLAVAGESYMNMRDLLFVNQGIKDGIPHFKELAHDYGIDDEGYGTMGAFFDYDKDGDLDLYLLTNALESFNRNNLRAKRVNGEAASTDRFYRNNGDNTFTNVSREAGILIEGYGLGVNICDINNDSWPDVYVSNDFLSNDLIWVNQKDGTFKNSAGEYVKHQTHNGMGVDVADFNNDALVDIAVVDMLPPDHKRQKMMTPGQNYDHFHLSEQMGYQPQYMRNTLQLNRGKFGDDQVLFSEVAFMAGVSRTDWSWAPLFADFDNDGWKDLFIANGYRKDVTDLDFIFFGLKSGNPFGTPEARKEKFDKELDALPDVKLPNYLFRNTGTLTFEDKTKAWGADLPTFSNGAAYADLDNDGDIDLVTNNIDQEVLIYENLQNKKENRSHFLKLHCRDTSTFNHKVWIFAQGKTQYQELTPYRGFQSSVSPHVLHFGLGSISVVDSVKIVWPDLSVAMFRNIPTDTMLEFSKAGASVKGSIQQTAPGLPLFTAESKIKFVHTEKSPSDIKSTRTLLHELSRFGPCATTGDVNGDALDDLFIGAERGTASRLFIQQADGTFTSSALSRDSTVEDGDAHFFDADGDKDLDLYVAGSCPSSVEAPGPHRLYRNDGSGGFSLANDVLPDLHISASSVESADYDGDGDLDLFVGGRLKANAYPLSPQSAVLRNDGGKFSDVTESLNSALISPGMITSAVWADIDNDKHPDLIMAGEWMPIRIFLNKGDTFEEATETYGLAKSNGWWTCLKASDLNNDGFVDIVAGNTGTNSYFQPTEEHPVRIFAKDFDNNGSVDPIITYYNPVEKDWFMVHNRLVIIDQIPSIKRRFEKFIQYATTPFDKAITKEEQEGAFREEVYTIASAVLVNNKGENFIVERLPEIAQASTLNDIQIDDLNGDGHADIIGVGNNYSQETLFGRYDASLGVVLLGDGALNWKSLEPIRSGFVADGNAKFIKSLNTVNSGKAFVVINNNDSLLYYSLRKQSRAIAGVKFQTPKLQNPNKSQ